MRLNNCSVTTALLTFDNHFHCSAIAGNKEKTSYERERERKVISDCRKIFFSSFQRNEKCYRLKEYLMETTSLGKIFLLGNTFTHSLFPAPLGRRMAEQELMRK